MSGVVSLVSDFGLSDWYVGAMKGVILGINPRATIIDLCHGVEQGDIVGAALALRASYRFFPRGTVHLVVVDPGVGSDRAILACEHGGFRFIAPDNGLLCIALGERALEGARAVESGDCRLGEVSRTFHGRDIFAPAAARLSLGRGIDTIGPPCGDYVRAGFPKPTRIGKGEIDAEVIHVDSFGNLISNVEEEGAVLGRCDDINLRIRGRSISGLKEAYCSAAPGELIALWGSSGLLEISVRGGSAAENLGAGRGTRFRLFHGTGAKRAPGGQGGATAGAS